MNQLLWRLYILGVRKKLLYDVQKMCVDRGGDMLMLFRALLSYKSKTSTPTEYVLSARRIRFCLAVIL